MSIQTLTEYRVKSSDPTNAVIYDTFIVGSVAGNAVHIKGTWLAPDAVEDFITAVRMAAAHKE